jgi:hypothetical protein
MSTYSITKIGHKIHLAYHCKRKIILLTKMKLAVFPKFGTELSGILIVWALLLDSYAMTAKACKVTGFKIWLKSDSYNPMTASILGRDDTQELKHNHFVCSAPNIGDNIEAIAENCSSNEVISFALRSRSGNENGAKFQTIFEASDSRSPYFLYGNDGTKVLGTTLPNGKYRIVANPQNALSGRKAVDFQVIDCSYFRPRNECSRCSNSETCEGGSCVSRAYMRITLLAYGPNTWDYGMNVTTPRGTVISANPKVYGNQYDPDKGGYIDVNDQSLGWRSTGVWVKNIVFKNATLIPSGKYTISLEDISMCGFHSLPLRRSFELKVFHKGRTVQTNTVDPSGKVVTFDI